MRYCVCAKVEGNIYLTKPGEVKRGDFIFDFRLGPDSRLSEIAVSISVPEDKLLSMASTFDSGDGNVKFRIKIGGNRDLYDKLISELQLLESDLSFATQGALRKIYWDNPNSIEFIPETDSEEDLPAISSFSFHRAYPAKPARFSIETMGGILNGTSQSIQLRIAKAFWREGLEYHNQFKYIQAFYSFYFVIEDYFARGKTGESEVLKQFLQSPQFQEISRKGFTEIINDQRHKEKLLRLFKDAGLEASLDNLPTFLFRMRGKLHHYYSESSKLQGTPFNQADFESLSLLVMYMTTETIVRHDQGGEVRS